MDRIHPVILVTVKEEDIVGMEIEVADMDRTLEWNSSNSQWEVILEDCFLIDGIHTLILNSGATKTIIEESHQNAEKMEKQSQILFPNG
jgi:hypothetical protein